MAQTWLITGSARGLGRALAEAVLEAGHNLVATARTPEQLADLAERFADTMVAAALDVTDEHAATYAVALAVERFGGLDILVNNAGYGDVAPIEHTSVESFRRQIETNLFGTIIVTKAAIPLFRQRRSGRFIQISSIGGRAGAIGRGAYSAAKFGVEGFSEVLAQGAATVRRSRHDRRAGRLSYRFRRRLNDDRGRSSRLCRNRRNRRRTAARL